MQVATTTTKQRHVSIRAKRDEISIVINMLQLLETGDNGYGRKVVMNKTNLMNFVGLSNYNVNHYISILMQYRFAFHKDGLFGITKKGKEFLKMMLDNGE